MFNILFLLLVAGASFRVTRLINDDSIVEPIRRKLPRPVRHFTDCPWCVGFWVALAFVAGHYFWYANDLFHLATLVLTISWVNGIAAQWLDSPPPQRVLHLIHGNEPPPVPTIPAPTNSH